MNNTSDPIVLDQMQSKLTRYIDKKRGNNETQIQAIEKDSRLIYDYLVPTDRMNFFNDVESDKVLLHFKDERNILQDITFHDNAITQIASKFDIPTKYLRDLGTGNLWQRDLAAEILQSHSSNAKQQRLLVRTVAHEARGVLSDSYKRMNSIILYSTFIAAAQASGAVVADAHYNGLTGYLEVIRPDVIVIPTENNGIQYICFGVQFRNSDFGTSSLEMRAFNFVIRCENGWTTQSVMRNVHLGARLPDNLELSQRTYDLDTRTKASLVKDTIGQLMDPERLMNYSVRVQEASKLEIDLQSEVKSLPQMGVHDSEVKVLEKLLMENDPNNNLEGGNTLFKLMQGLSAVSRDSNATRKREIDEITGKLFDRIKVKA